MIKHTDRLLNASNGRGLSKTGITTDGYTLEGGSITALRQAIKQAGKQKPVAWLHRMDNTEGIKSNGKGVVVIDEYRPHPFGLVGVDFDESYPITSTPLYTSAQQQKPWVGLTPEGNVIKYVTRHKSKGGRADILKAIHYLEKILEVEYGVEE